MRRFFSFLTLAMVFAFASCMKEEVDLGSGSEETVRFSVSLPQQEALSRAAFSDPALEDMRVVLMVMYGTEDETPTVVHTETKTGQTFGTVNFDVRLVTGKPYTISVWADFGENYYSIVTEEEGAPKVTMKSMEITGSNNWYDAYFAIVPNKVLTANETVEMELTRPFALVKINTLDYNQPTVTETGLIPTNYATTIEVPTEMNLLDGTVGVPANVTIKNETGSNVADFSTGELSFDYFFVNENEQPNLNFDVVYSNAQGEIVAYSFNNIPVRRNYKTNISGNILTKQGTISVTVDPNWAGDLSQVATAEDLMTAITNAKNGDVIELAEDILLPQGLTMSLAADESVVIDLNGKTLSFTHPTADDVTVNSGTLFVKGGKINAEQKSSPVGGGFVAAETGTVVLEEVEYTTNGCALFVAGEGKGVIRNSTVNAGAYAVTSNAMEQPQNITVTLEGSTFTASTPILLNVPSTITVDDCTITGTTQGMVVRGGTATVSNSTITLEYNDGDYEDIVHYFDNINWGSGNMLTCAALTIGNKASGAYQYPTDVTLKNTELKLGGTYGSYFPALYAYANSGEGLGVTLNFDDECTFDKMPEYGSTNIMVNGVAPIFNETTSTAFASVQEAVDAASNGDVITLAPGNYNEIIKNGGDGVTIKGTDGAKVKAIYLNSGNTIFENVEFYGEGESSGSYSTIFVGSSATVTLKNCEINVSEAIQGRPVETAYGADVNLTMENCTITANRAKNAYLNPVGANGSLTVRNCTFVDKGLTAEFNCDANSAKVMPIIEGNNFGGNSLGFSYYASPAISDANGLDDTTKEFCNDVLRNNTFTGVNKIKVTPLHWVEGNFFWINDEF